MHSDRNTIVFSMPHTYPIDHKLLKHSVHYSVHCCPKVVGQKLVVKLQIVTYNTGTCLNKSLDCLFPHILLCFVQVIIGAAIQNKYPGQCAELQCDNFVHTRV